MALEHQSALPQTLATAHVRDAGRITQEVGWQLTADALEVTHNSGATWSNVTPTNVQPDLIRAVSFNDPLHGWLVTSASACPAGSELLAYRTTDGGRNWLPSQVAAPSVEFADATEGPAWIDSLDAQRGWVAVQLATSSNFSRSELFRTDDGGATWSQLNSPAAGAIAFATPMDGWLVVGVENSQLFSTHDAGQMWSAAAPPLPTGTAPEGVAYAPAARPGAVGLRADIAGNPGSALLFNLTAQNTWHLVQHLQDSSIGESNPAAMPLAVAGPGALVTVLDRGQEIAAVPVAGGAATSLKSNLPIAPNAAVSTLSFASQRDGWAIVSGTACAQFKRDCASYSALYATSDGGASWTQLGR